MIETISSKEPNKIYCANCVHCKLIREASENDHYVLRVRCAAGKWRKKLGEEKFYKYFTVARRAQKSCDAYTPMGEAKSFMKDLRKNLPVRDEEYTTGTTI